MSSSLKPKFCLTKSIASMLATLCLAGTVEALPQGGQVVHGSASMKQTGDKLTVRPSDNAIINYRSFGIEKGETVQFIQRSSNSRVLNRVTEANPTHIFGTLQANGKVYLVNPYGIFMENGSVLNVGGLIAAAGTLSNADFVAARDHFTQLNGDVTNSGLINAKGNISLLGESVANFGSLVSQEGMVTMASGNDILIGERTGNVFVNATSTGPASAAKVGVQNTGAIRAPRAVLAAGDLFSVAIANSGVIVGRDVTLKGGANSTVSVSGLVDVSSKTGKGGSAKFLGGHLELRDATVDASGAFGGGTILVGGDLHGQGTEMTASTTLVDASSILRADATVRGNGGKVVLWSEKGTAFDGQISARGGLLGGNGGLSEVSGKAWLGYNGSVVLTAPVGKTGSLLLDPDTITIVTGGANSITGGLVSFPDTPTTTLISPTTLQNTLVLANVTLQANQDIVFSNDVTSTGTFTLNLQAGHKIDFGATTLTLAGGLNATANDSGGTGFSAVATTASITSTGSIITSGNLTLTTNGGAVQLATVNAGTGAISLSGSTGVSLGGTVSGASLGVTGTTTIAGPSITTTAAQTYNSAVTVSGATVLTGNSITTIGTLAAGTNNLTLTAGSVTLGGPATGTGHVVLQGLTAAASFPGFTATTLGNVGSGFADLTLGRADGTQNNGLIGLTLPTNTIFRSDTGNYTFSTLSGAKNLTVQSNGTTTFNGAINVASLTTDAGGSTVIGASSITTSGTQTFGDNTTTGSALTLTASTVNFNKRLSPGGDSAVGTIGITGNLVFGAAADLHATVGTTSDQITVTAGATTITAGALLSGEVSGAAPASGTALPILVTPSRSGTFANAANQVTISGRAYSISTTGNLTVTGTQSTLVWTGLGTALLGFSDPLNFLGGLLTPITGDVVEFTSGTFSASQTIPGLSLSQLQFDSGSNVSLTGTGITLTGATGILQTGAATVTAITAPLTLGSNTIFTASNSLSLGQILSPTAHTLEVSGAGQAIFTGALGSTANPLQSFEVKIPATVRGDITTATTQIFDTDVTIGAALVNLKSTTNQAILFKTKVDGEAGFARGLHVISTGLTTLGDKVGSQNHLDSLQIDGTSLIKTDVITTDHNQIFTGAMTLASSNPVFNSVSGALTFGKVDSDTTARNFTATANGIVTLSGDLGAQAGGPTLASLSITAGNSIAISTSQILTSGTQTYEGKTSTGSALSLAASTVNFNQRLSPGGDSAAGTIGITGNLVFGAAADLHATIGTTSDKITVTSGATTITAGAVLSGELSGVVPTTGTALPIIVTPSRSGTFANPSSQVTVAGRVYGISAVGNVTLTGLPSTLIWTGLGTAVLGFNDPLNFLGGLITPITGDNVEFTAGTFNAAQTISGLSLNQLQFDSGSTVTLTGTALTLTGATGILQAGAGTVTTITAPLSLGADTIFTASNSLSLGQILSPAAHTLEVSGAGQAFFTGAVGTTANPLQSIEAKIPATVRGDITTATTQTFDNDVTIGAALVNLKSTTNQAIIFKTKLDGEAGFARGLHVITTGQTTLGDKVGSGNHLDSLQIDGTSLIKTDVITTDHNQIFTGAMTLASSNPVFTSALGALTFGTVNSDTTARNFTAMANGIVNLNGDLGAQAGGPALASISITGNSIALSSAAKNFISTGDQTYAGTITQAAAALFNATAAKSTLSFSAINSLGNDLTLRADRLAPVSGAITGSGNAHLTVSPATDLSDTVNGATGIELGGASSDGPRALLLDNLLGKTSGYKLLTIGASDVDIPITAGALTLNVDTELVSKNQKITLAAVDSNASTHFNFTATTGSAIVLGGNLGLFSASSSLQNVKLDGDVQLSAGIKMVSEGDVTFTKKVDGQAPATQDLTIAAKGDVNFSGQVGSGFTLKTLDVTSGAAKLIHLNGGLVKTSGNQSYTGKVQLGADTLLDAEDTSATPPVSKIALGVVDAKTFNLNLQAFEFDLTGAVQGANNRTLALLAPASATSFLINGGTGASQGLYPVAIDNVSTDNISGFQVLNVGTLGRNLPIYANNFKIGTNTALLSGSGEISLHAVDSVATGLAQILTVTTSGKVTLGGQLGMQAVGPALSSLNINGTGAILVKTDAVKTAGTQQYGGATGGAISLDTAIPGLRTTLTSTGNAAIAFTSTIDAPAQDRGLIVATTGTTTAGDSIGKTNQLLDLKVNGPLTFKGDTILTSGDQTFLGAVSLNQNTLVRGTGAASTLTLTGVAAGAKNLIAKFDNMTFAGASNSITGTGLLTLLPNDAARTIGVAGGAGDLNIDATDYAKINSLFSGIVFGQATGAGLITVSPIVLKADTTFLSGTGNQVFGTIDGDSSSTRSLLVNAGGTATFGGTIGATKLATIDVTASTINVNAPSISSSGNQTYRSPVALNQNGTTPSTSVSGANLFFQQKVNGASNLTLVAGLTTFGSVIGGVTTAGTAGAGTALTSLDVTGPVDVVSNLVNQGSIQTNGSQRYRSDISTSANGVLGMGAGTTMQFDSGLLGSNAIVSLAAPTIAFVRSPAGDIVGTSNLPLASLTTGSTSDLRTVGNIYADAVKVQGTMNLTGATLISGKTSTEFDQAIASLSGPFGLTIQTSDSIPANVVTLKGDVANGANAGLKFLHVTAQDLKISAGTIHTSEDQTFTAATVVQNNLQLTSDNANANGRINFDRTVEGVANAPKTLTINTANKVSFGDTVGLANALQSLTVNNTGSETDLSALTSAVTSITTIGDQLYTGKLVLNAGTTLRTSNLDFTSGITTGVVDAQNSDLETITYNVNFQGAVTGSALNQIKLTPSASATSVLVQNPVTSVPGLHPATILGSANITGFPNLTIGSLTNDLPIYAGNLQLGVNTTFRAGNAEVQLATVDSTAAAARSLVVDSVKTITLQGALGAQAAGPRLQSVTLGVAPATSPAAPLRINLTATANAVKTVENQVYNGLVDGPAALTLDGTGVGSGKAISFAYSVGSNSALTSLTVSAGTVYVSSSAAKPASVTASDFEKFADDVSTTASGTVSFAATGPAGSIEFTKTLNGSLANFNLNGKTLVLGHGGDVVGTVAAPVATLTTSSGSNSLLNGLYHVNSVNVAGTATLAGDSSFLGQAANATTGAMVFAKNIGSQTATLNSLNIDAGLGRITINGDVVSVSDPTKAGLKSLTLSGSGMDAKDLPVPDEVIIHVGENAVFDLPVNLQSNILLLSDGSATTGTLRFKSTIDSVRGDAKSLRINTAGDVFFDGNVGILAPLQNLSSTALVHLKDGSTGSSSSKVLALGDVQFNSGLVLGAVTNDVRAASVTLIGDVTSHIAGKNGGLRMVATDSDLNIFSDILPTTRQELPSYLVLAAPKGTLTVQSLRALQDIQLQSPLINLGNPGPVGDPATEAVRIEAGNRVSLNVGVAAPADNTSTILHSNGSSLLLSAALVEMGYGQKLNASVTFDSGSSPSVSVIPPSGNLTIDATVARLGDIASAGLITVKAQSVQILARAPYAGVEGLQSGTFDQGTSILGAGVTFEHANGTALLPTVVQPYAGASFGAHIVKRFSALGESSNSQVGYHYVQDYPTALSAFYQRSPDALFVIQPLDGIANPLPVSPATPQLTQNLTVQNNQPVMKNDSTQLDSLKQANLSPGDQDKLQQLGVYARLINDDERRNIMQSGQSIFRQPIEGQVLVQEPEYMVVVNRVTEHEVGRTLSVYDRLMGEHSERSEAVIGLMAAVADRFAAVSGGGDPSGLSSWVKTDAAAHADAGSFVEILERLHLLYEDVSSMGLTKKEVEISKNAIARKFAYTTHVQTATFRAMIEEAKVDGALETQLRTKDIKLAPLTPAPAAAPGAEGSDPLAVPPMSDPMQLNDNPLQFKPLLEGPSVPTVPEAPADPSAPPTPAPDAAPPTDAATPPVENAPAPQTPPPAENAAPVTPLASLTLPVH